MEKRRHKGESKKGGILYQKYGLKEIQKREDVRDEGEQRGRVEKWKNRRKIL